MKKTYALAGFLAGLGTGAAAMYLFDPERGTRRRAIARDKIMSSARHFTQTATGLRKDLSNRGMGIWFRVGYLINPGEASDAVIEQRVRSKMGRVVSHPHAIKVTSMDGNVTLNGMVMADELQALLRCVRSIPGVRSVEHDLKDHDMLKTDSRPKVQEFIPSRRPYIH